MKKTFKWMMMALAAIVVTVGFAACGDDDDDNNGGSGKGYYSLSLELSYSEDFLSAFDVTVSYTDANGQEKTEQVTSTSFNKQINYSSTPSAIKYSITRTKKANLPTKEKLDFDVSEAVCVKLTQDGKSMSVGNAHSLKKITKGVQTAKLDSYISANKMSTPATGEYRP